MMQQHRILPRVNHPDPIGSPEERNVIQTILEQFPNPRSRVNISDKLPSLSLSRVVRPVISIWSSTAKERNNKSHCWRWTKSNTSNVLSSCLNILSEEGARLEISPVELIKVLDGLLDPDFALGAPDFGERAFSLGFDEVDYCNWSQGVLSNNGRWMICGQDFEPRCSMCRSICNPTELRDFSFAKHGPHSCISKGNDDIWIGFEKLGCETMKLGSKLSADVFRLVERWVAEEGFFFRAGEREDVIVVGP